MRVIIAERGVEYKTLKDAPSIRTPLDVEKHLAELKNSETEQFAVLVLNAKNKLKVSEIVTSGINDASLVHPREVFRTAVRESGNAIVLAHNHPSGDCQPSLEDIRITKQMVEAGKVLDIKVLDHVVLGDSICSMREDGIVKF